MPERVPCCSSGIYGRPGFGTTFQSSVVTLYFLLRISPASLDHKLFFDPFLPTPSHKPPPQVCRSLLHILCLLKCFSPSDTRSRDLQEIFSHSPELPALSSAHSILYDFTLAPALPSTAVIYRLVSPTKV